MCGIVGVWTPGGCDPTTLEQVLLRMVRRLHARGPDGEGVWLDRQASLALGHRRLAVVELSVAGQQPMLSANGRFAMVFNGEIYNHLELRRRLGDRQWRGQSDTETFLEAVSTWGLPDALRQAVGMFALAVWDREERTLSLARDRLGEKPLYFGWQGKTFLFASELKALRAHPQFSAPIDRRALGSLVRKGFIPAPQSIYVGVSKLSPGCIATLDLSSPGQAPRLDAYWSLESAVAQGLASPFEGTPDEAVDELERLLREAVKGQMVADVPLGAFLSGGIDSSAIVAMMQSQSARPVRTYAIGFSDPRYNEADHARAVADHLGTHHTELVASPTDALDLIPRLPEVYDEPFADMSQIPTLLVSHLARRDVTVALSGDGGDELFAGYGRYPQAIAAWKRLSIVPLLLRQIIKPLLPRSVLKAGIASPDLQEFYRFMNTQWKEWPNLVRQEPPSPHPQRRAPATLDDLGRMMYSDLSEYLPDDILVKVDRAAMFYSLETRVPFLDHRIVEFSFRLSSSLKLRDGTQKWPLKQLLYRHVPKALVDRPKRGFAVPMQSWLRSDLRDWAEALLASDRLSREGYFDVRAVRTEWASHLAGRKDRHYALWAVLMFQQWLASTE